MPPRIPTFSGLRQCLLRPAAQQQTQSATLSTTTRLSAFRDPRTSTTSSSLLSLDLDSSSGSGSSSSSPRSTKSHDALTSMLHSSEGRGWGTRRAARAAERPSTKEELRNRNASDKFVRQMPRYWREGDVYAPQDLGAYEARKWRDRGKMPKQDVMDVLGVNPLDMYKNFSLIGDFITPFGRIRHSRETGLRLVNQRKMAKTIRRAIGLGLHPSVYRHPMMLLRESRKL